MSQPLLTEAEVAQRLNTTPRHVKAMRMRREIPYVHVGRLVRFDPADVERWLEANTVGAAEQRTRAVAS